MFFMRRAASKAPVCRRAQNNGIVPGLLINMKDGWGTIPAVLSGANRGRHKALKLSRWPIKGSLHCLAVTHSQMDSIWCGLCFCLTFGFCVCMSHSWDAGNCFSVFTPWLNISLPLHLYSLLIWPYRHNPFAPNRTTSRKKLPPQCFS